MNLSKLASNAMYWGIASTASAAFLQMVQLAFLARFLDPAQFGLAAMMTVAMGLAGVYGDMGLSNAILTHSPLTRRMLSSLYWIGLLAGAVVTAGVIAAAPLAARFFSQPQLTSLLRWASLVFLINPIGLQYKLLLQRDLEFRPITLINIPSNLLGACITIICAWQGFGVMSYVVGSVTTSILAAAALLNYGYRRWPLSFECAPSEARELIGFGAYQLGERTLNYFTRNLDRILIGWLLGASALGYYSTAAQLMQKPIQMVQPLVNRITIPLFVHIRDSTSRLANAYLLVVELCASLLFPVYVLVIVLAAPLVRVFLGARWQPVAPILQWLSVLGCFIAIGFPVGSLLIALKRADFSFWLNVWRLIPFAAAVIIGSHYGLIGIAIALLLAQVLGMFPLGFWLRARLANISASRYLDVIAAPALIAAAVGLCTKATLLIAQPLPRTQTIALGAIMFSILYGGCFLLFRRSFVMRMKEHLGWSPTNTVDTKQAVARDEEA